MCVCVQMPVQRLGTKQVMSPRGAGVVENCPSGHSGRKQVQPVSGEEKGREERAKRTASHNSAGDPSLKGKNKGWKLSCPTSNYSIARPGGRVNKTAIKLGLKIPPASTHTHTQNSPHYDIPINQPDCPYYPCRDKGTTQTARVIS